MPGMRALNGWAPASVSSGFTGDTDPPPAPHPHTQCVTLGRYFTWQDSVSLQVTCSRWGCLPPPPARRGSGGRILSPCPGLAHSSLHDRKPGRLPRRGVSFIEHVLCAGRWELQRPEDTVLDSHEASSWFRGGNWDSERENDLRSTKWANPGLSPAHRAWKPKLFSETLLWLWAEVCPPHFICWSPNPQSLKMWLHWEKMPLRRWLRYNEVTKVGPDPMWLVSL